MHVGSIKVMSPWLPGSTGRGDLCSCRTDIRWSSALAYPVCSSETSWGEFGLMRAGPEAQRNELKLASFVRALSFVTFTGVSV